VWAGAELVATHVNRIARRDDGEHPDTGGWVRLLEYASGESARVLGKPSPSSSPPLEALGRGADTALVVGDNLAVDIGSRQAVSAATVLACTGKATVPSQAPRPSRTRSSTASPTCPDCSNADRLPSASTLSVSRALPHATQLRP
jgi:ribonucleotide monophosphatase NagD (HAD superfamily)